MVATDSATSIGELAAGLRVAVTRLNRRLRSSSLGGVSPAQASALAMIERRPPSMTRLVDALERDGLVERRVDDADRRCQRVTLTHQGRRALGSIRGRKTAFLEARLARLTPEDREAVARALGILQLLAGDG